MADHRQEKPTVCPRCNSGRFIAIAPTDADRHMDWFQCELCRHIWSEQRRHTET